MPDEVGAEASIPDANKLYVAGARHLEAEAGRLALRWPPTQAVVAAWRQHARNAMQFADTWGKVRQDLQSAAEFASSGGTSSSRRAEAAGLNRKLPDLHRFDLFANDLLLSDLPIPAAEDADKENSVTLMLGGLTLSGPGGSEGLTVSERFFLRGLLCARNSWVQNSELRGFGAVPVIARGGLRHAFRDLRHKLNTVSGVTGVLTDGATRYTLYRLNPNLVFEEVEKAEPNERIE